MSAMDSLMIETSAQDLRAALVEVLAQVGFNDVDPNLALVEATFGVAGWRLTATNRSVLCSVEGGQLEGQLTTLLLPAEGLRTWLNLLEEGKQAKLGIECASVKLRCGRKTSTVKAVDGRWPHWQLLLESSDSGGGSAKVSDEHLALLQVVAGTGGTCWEFAITGPGRPLIARHDGRIRRAYVIAQAAPVDVKKAS